jgi:hypothetical protein
LSRPEIFWSRPATKTPVALPSALFIRRETAVTIGSSIGPAVAARPRMDLVIYSSGGKGRHGLGPATLTIRSPPSRLILVSSSLSPRPPENAGARRSTLASFRGGKVRWFAVGRAFGKAHE